MPADDELKALSDDLARAGQSAAEPRCLALAFATPAPGELRLTMQQWIDLEAIRSPLLRAAPFADADELRLTGAVFGLEIAPEILSPEDAADTVAAMREAVDSAFALALPMQPPQQAGTSAPDGFGAWLPVTAFLEAECHKARAEARAYPVGEAFALLAAARRNQGWEPKDATYAQRDVLQVEEDGDGD